MDKDYHVDAGDGKGEPAGVGQEPASDNEKEPAQAGDMLGGDMQQAGQEEYMQEDDVHDDGNDDIGGIRMTAQQPRRTQERLRRRSLVT